MLLQRNVIRRRVVGLAVGDYGNNRQSSRLSITTHANDDTRNDDAQCDEARRDNADDVMRTQLRRARDRLVIAAQTEIAAVDVDTLAVLEHDTVLVLAGIALAPSVCLTMAGALRHSMYEQTSNEQPITSTNNSDKPRVR